MRGGACPPLCARRRRPSQRTAQAAARGSKIAASAFRASRDAHHRDGRVRHRYRDPLGVDVQRDGVLGLRAPHVVVSRECSLELSGERRSFFAEPLLLRKSKQVVVVAIVVTIIVVAVVFIDVIDGGGGVGVMCRQKVRGQDSGGGGGGGSARPTRLFKQRRTTAALARARQLAAPTPTRRMSAATRAWCKSPPTCAGGSNTPCSRQGGGGGRGLNALPPSFSQKIAVKMLGACALNPPLEPTNKVHPRVWIHKAHDRCLRRALYSLATRRALERRLEDRATLIAVDPYLCRGGRSRARGSARHRALREDERIGRRTQTCGYGVDPALLRRGGQNGLVTYGCQRRDQAQDVPCRKRRNLPIDRKNQAPPHANARMAE
ncbi:hypothetical protein HYPSUDRAFT_51614 [Hypholoma sublateritium FD-334 SS-4]|uniref:Uncharacterized protein n=1 Tax=Hypholoma sublateritium (strain FD-334 SS-4) TaxID=945553 RepID=A0A0D2Q9B7_HYPSF|nr:hypothetical protein HYPSUDRAFT_51614 [Hypholoma sublateritium FD-334 SS-4]